MLHATGLGPLNNFLLVLNLSVDLNKKRDVREVHLLTSLLGRHSKAKEKVKEFEHVNPRTPTSPLPSPLPFPPHLQQSRRRHHHHHHPRNRV